MPILLQVSQRTHKIGAHHDDKHNSEDGNGHHSHGLTGPSVVSSRTALSLLPGQTSSVQHQLCLCAGNLTAHSRLDISG
ncbi:hypothetical protein ACOMHN_065788 [Nucella lapillus]